jgi:hypothetical protein
MAAPLQEPAMLARLWMKLKDVFALFPAHMTEQEKREMKEELTTY